MAINPESQYPGKIAPATSGYPYGAARNITVPGDGSGTPWEAALVNDLFGFQQALLSEAGIVPTGTPDKVGGSQYLDAVKKIGSGLYTVTFETIQKMQIGESIGGKTVSFSEGMVLSTGGTIWDVTTEVTTLPLGGSLYAKPRGIVNIIDFGLVGDGTTDNKAGLEAAEAADFPYFIPEGEFGTTGRHTFGKSFIGAGSALSKITNLDVTSASTAWLIAFNGLNGAVVSGFSADGQTTSTPGTPNIDPVFGPSTYDVWYGSRGVIFSSCEKVLVQDVAGFNSGGGACVRVEQCTDVVFVGCYAERARGNFGDTFYSFAGLRIKFTDCHGYDFTRIGFVSEGNPSTARVSDKIYYSGCTAQYGHDQSANYGGGEYNVGFWHENTDDCGLVNCHSYDTEEGGFIYAPTQHSDGKTSAKCNYSGCTAVSTRLGFKVNTLTSFTTIAEASYNGCSAKNVTLAYATNITGTGNIGRVNYVGCNAYISNGADSNAGTFFLDGTGTTIYANIKDCVTDWNDTSKFSDTAANTADITQFADAVRYITVDNLINITGESCIKNRQSAGGEYRIRNMPQSTYVYFSTGVNINFMEVDNSSVYGQLKTPYIELINAAVKSGEELQVVDCEIYGDIKLVDALLFVFHSAGVLETKRIVGEITTHMERNVATSDFGLRLQCEQTIKPSFVVDGTFYNSGAAAAAGENFIYIVRSGTGVYTKGAIKDDTVPNIYRINTTPGNFTAAQQNVTLH